MVVQVREIKSILRIYLPQGLKHHLPHDRRGQYIQPVSMEYFYPKIQHQLLWLEGWAHGRGGGQISPSEWTVMKFTPYRAFVPAAMAILCTVTMNMKETEWHSLDRSSCLLIMKNYLWSCCLCGQLCGNKSSHSAYSVRLTLIPPPRPPTHQLFKSVFFQGLDQQRHYSVRGHPCDTAVLKVTTSSWCWPTVKIYV